MVVSAIDDEFKGLYFRVGVKQQVVVVVMSASNDEFKGLEFRVGVK